MSGSRRATTLLLAALLIGLTALAGPAAADPTPDGPDTTVAEPVDTTVAAGDPTTTSADTVPGGVTTTTDASPPVTAGPGGFGGLAVDPDAPPEPPMPDPSPQVRVLLAQLRLQSQQERLDVQLAKLEAVRGDEERVAATVRDAEAALAAARAQVRASEDRLRAQAMSYYVNPEQSGIEKLIAAAPEGDRTKTVLIESSIDVELDTRDAALDRVAERERQLEARRDDLVAAKARTAAQQANVDSSTRSRDYRSSELAKSRNLSPDWALPIAGNSVFTAEELTLWFEQRGNRSHAQAPIAELAEAYIAEGRDEHIRGDMAFAQSVLETGSFSNDDTIRFNNFAGVGHCDTCATGFAFPSPALGVRAQIQLLRDYTQKGAKLAHPLVDRRLRGPSGCCQDWTELTSTWATNTNYGPKILGVYREMLHWLVQHRGMAPLVGPG